MFLTALSALGGGLLRNLPEIFKFFDRKNDRSHELAMSQLSFEYDKFKVQAGLSLGKEEIHASIAANELQAIMETTRAQATLTGVKWVDAISSLMRPMITFWWVIVLYTVAEVATFIYMVNLGSGYADVIMKLWGPDEKAIVGSIIGFWFADRALRKK